MTVTVNEILSGATPPGVYRYQGRAIPATIARQTEAAGWRFVHLEGAQIDCKSALLEAVATAANFPTYCGHNWDALEECLRDLSWAPALGYLILWDDARILARSDPQAFATGLSIFRAVAQYWETKGTPFVLLLRRSGRSSLPS